MVVQDVLTVIVQAVSIAVAKAAFDWLEKRERDERDDDGHAGAEVETGTNGKTDRGGHPQAGGRSQTRHASPAAEDGPTTEETDSDDDLRGDPGHVGAQNRVGLVRELVEAVSRDQREQASTGRHEDMGPKPGRAVTQLSLQTNQAAQTGGQQKPDGKLDVTDHGGSLPTLNREGASPIESLLKNWLAQFDLRKLERINLYS
jgi:hypothetical protein